MGNITLEEFTPEKTIISRLIFGIILAIFISLAAYGMGSFIRDLKNQNIKDLNIPELQKVGEFRIHENTVKITEGPNKIINIEIIPNN